MYWEHVWSYKKYNNISCTGLYCTLVYEYTYLQLYNITIYVIIYNCERNELSGEFNGTDFLSLYISGHTSCRKCSKCFYVYLNIRPMRYSAMQF